MAEDIQYRPPLTTAKNNGVIYATEIKGYYNNHIDSGGMPLQIAYVGSPAIIGAYEPGSELAREAHLPTILTTDKNEALLWLGVKAPSSPPADTDAQSGG